jgi:hypothetical protein
MPFPLVCPVAVDPSAPARERFADGGVQIVKIDPEVDAGRYRQLERFARPLAEVGVDGVDPRCADLD